MLCAAIDGKAALHTDRLFQITATLRDVAQDGDSAGVAVSHEGPESMQVGDRTWHQQL